ncbi:ATP-binding cassette domain-containing protein [Bradyrhizobium lupini]|uniref:ATP-binding cassette domain-containing protein n=1 Tax=Rhizobium lupini TaxID=136996 RepID=UPI00366AE9A7
MNDVSFLIWSGEIVALLGANGAGKSATLQAISALSPPWRGQVAAGRILFDGQDIVSAPPAKLVRAGIVPVVEGRHYFSSRRWKRTLSPVLVAETQSPA